jgi:hypothetical protein
MRPLDADEARALAHLCMRDPLPDEHTREATEREYATCVALLGNGLVRIAPSSAANPYRWRITPRGRMALTIHRAFIAAIDWKKAS